MKVIDLLNKIANGEEAPKRIKTKNDVWVYDDEDCEGIDYRASDDRGYMFEVHTRINKEDLNEEVEIIEEDKEIERLKERIEDLNTINEEHQILNGMIRKELQQKENIIKEVREYIEKNWISQKDADNYRFDDAELIIEISDTADLFDILDKGKE